MTTPNEELVERVKDAMLDALVTEDTIGETGQAIMEALDMAVIRRLDTDRLSNWFVDKVAAAAIAAMQPEIAAAYQRGFEAGQRAVEVAPDVVHPAARFDVIADYGNTENGANGEIRVHGWKAACYFPEGGKKGFGFGVAYGEGPTRVAAILDACAKAKEANDA